MLPLPSISSIFLSSMYSVDAILLSVCHSVVVEPGPRSFMVLALYLLFAHDVGPGSGADVKELLVLSTVPVTRPEGCCRLGEPGPAVC
jgi:hypothetical protein